MRFDKLTIKAQEAIQDAQAVATRFQHSTLEVDHLLLAMVEQNSGTTRPLLEKVGVDPDRVRTELNDELQKLPKVQGAANYGAAISNRLQKIFNDAFSEAELMQDEYVSTEHLLLSITSYTGDAGKILRGFGATKELVQKAIEDLRGGRRVTDPNAEDKHQALEKNAIDLTP